jgi:hypothetical protein
VTLVAASALWIAGSPDHGARVNVACQHRLKNAAEAGRQSSHTATRPVSQVSMTQNTRAMPCMHAGQPPGTGWCAAGRYGLVASVGGAGGRS